jgi:hypothetical protein
VLNVLKEVLEQGNIKEDATLEILREHFKRYSEHERLAGTRARKRMHGIAATFHATICRELQEMAYHEPLRPVPKRIEKSAKDDPALSEWWRLASEDSALRRINDWFASNPHTKHHRLIFDYLLPVSKYSDLVAQLGGEISADQALEAALAAKIESEGLCEEHMYGNGIWGR